MTDEDPGMSADGKFQPNVINSAVFLLAAVMQVCTLSLLYIRSFYFIPATPLSAVHAFTVRYVLSVQLCVTFLAYLNMSVIGSSPSFLKG